MNPPLCLSNHQPLFVTVSSLSIECNFNTACCGQTLAGAHLCGVISLLRNSMKCIPYNYKCLIFSESSGISLCLPAAQSRDNYEKGIWTCTNLGFTLSPR